MTTQAPPAVFSAQPSALNCEGRELVDLLASIRRSGGIVVALNAVCTARWHVVVHWPTARRFDQYSMEHSDN